ncbi:MAG TPA: hypothetical protein VMR25_24350 [Planctomycetaceae bacterium]|nr:hypothetical protein [Planctomycetaceae bacterium]
MSQPPVDPDRLLDTVIERLRQQQAPPMPSSLIDPAIHSARRNDAPRFFQTLRPWIKQRPVPIAIAALAVAAVGLFWSIGPFELRRAITPPPGYRVERRLRPKNESEAKDDRSLVVAPEIGIGPVRFGMTQEQIVHALGKPDRTTTTESSMPLQTRSGRYSKPRTYVTTVLDYGSRGFELEVSRELRIGESTYPGYGLLHIRVFNPANSGPTVGDFPGKTREGIRLGATPDDVLRVCGKSAEKSEIESYRTLTYPELGYVFEFRQGKLTSISLNWPHPADTLRAGTSYVEQPLPAIRK